MRKIEGSYLGRVMKMGVQNIKEVVASKEKWNEIGRESEKHINLSK